MPESSVCWLKLTSWHKKPGLKVCVKIPLITICSTLPLTGSLWKTSLKRIWQNPLKSKDVRPEDGKYIQVLRGISNIRKMGGVKAVEGLICNRLPKLRMRKKPLRFCWKTDAAMPKAKTIRKKASRTASRNKANMPKRIYPCICSALKNLRRAENRFLHRRTKIINCFMREVA